MSGTQIEMINQKFELGKPLTNNEVLHLEDWHFRLGKILNEGGAYTGLVGQAIWIKHNSLSSILYARNLTPLRELSPSEPDEPEAVSGISPR